MRAAARPRAARAAWRAAPPPTPRAARSARGPAPGSSGSPRRSPCGGRRGWSPVDSSKCRVSWTTFSPASSTPACRVISYRTARSTERSEFTFLVSERVPSSAGAARRQRQVHVAAQRALVHPHVRDPERAQQVAQRRDVGAGHLGRTLPRPGDHLRDDLDQRDAGAVVVEQRVLRAVDPPRRAADVQRLAGVLLHVGALDLHADGGPVVERTSSQPLTAIGSSYWLVWKFFGMSG